MKNSPFSDTNAIKFLRQREIHLTNDDNNCDIILGHRLPDLIPFIVKHKFNKKYLIWTHEPRWDKHFKKSIKPFGILPSINIMNVYTGDVFMNNYHVLGSKKLYSTLDYVDDIDLSTPQSKKIVVLSLYRNSQHKWSLKKNGRELDLCYLRTQIALEGYKLGKMDIYGRGWPKKIAIEDSKGKGWRASKMDILKKYNFNLCLENTNFDYYCTEKIWDSIMGYNLPIYYGDGNRIYEDFPENSFLNYCDFKTPYALFQYIDEMDKSEFINRMNLCIKVFNNTFEKLKTLQLYENVLLKIVSRVTKIVST